MKNFEKRVKGLMNSREFRNDLYNHILIVKNRTEREAKESETAGGAPYVAPPSEEEFERGPGGATTPLLFTDQPISEGTLSSAHGFGPGGAKPPRLMEYAELQAKLDELNVKLNHAQRRKLEKHLTDAQRGKVAQELDEAAEHIRLLKEGQIHASAYALLRGDWYEHRRQKLEHLYSIGGVERVQTDWNPRSPSESLSLSLMVTSFLSVAANASRIGVGTNSGFVNDINALEAQTELAVIAQAAMVANDTTTNKANFRYACEPLHGMLSDILKDLRALRARVTPNDYYLMGLPAAGDNHHTPIPDPTEVLTFVITKTGLGRLYFEVRRPNGKRAKEYGVHGYEIRIVEIDDATNAETYTWTENCMSFFTTKSTGEIELGTANRGKHYFVTVRAENTKGRKGPTSPTQGFVLG